MRMRLPFRAFVAAAIAVVLGVPSASAQWQYPGPMAIDPDGNGILEPNETVSLSPSWGNGGPTIMCLGLTLRAFNGPAGPAYVVVQGSGGTLCWGPYSPPQTCNYCYVVRIDAATRPVLHWEASVQEGPLVFTTRTMHVGATFVDVPPSSPFYRFVERIVHRGATEGCGGGAYCPGASMTREQLAVFVLRARDPLFTPPACTTPIFGDVPASSPFCPWIEELARRGVVGGCGGGNYCPGDPVTREQMAVYVVRVLNIVPPACTTPMFADVPASNSYCPWIEELARRGVVSGCGGGNYCPAAAVTREQMSVFLAVGFNLQF